MPAYGHIYGCSRRRDLRNNIFVHADDIDGDTRQRQGDRIMNDIKQAILDELDGKFFEPQISKELSDRQFHMNVATRAAIEVIESRLEGMVIVPDKPTEDMLLAVSESYAGMMGDYCEADQIEDYEIMLKSFKAQK